MRILYFGQVEVVFHWRRPSKTLFYVFMLHQCFHSFNQQVCPAGTRIIYDRKFLLQCRTSPLTRTPPNLPDIPGVTRPLKPDSPREAPQPEQTASNNTDLSEQNAGKRVR